MCNSSLPINNSTTKVDETLNVYNLCVCQGHFGIVFIFVITILFLSLGMPVHSYSLWLSLHVNIKPNSVFPLNISIIELFFSILSFTDLIVLNCLSMTSFQFAMFLNGICWTVRPLLQICLCLEHYVAVIHPVTFLRYNSIQYRIALAAASWLIGLANSSRLILMGTDIFPDHIFFVFFCIALLTASYCCVSILHVLKRPGPGDLNSVETTAKGRPIENQQKRKAYSIISHTLMSILVCYFPIAVAYVTLMAEISKETYICIFFPACLSITLVTVIITPLNRMYNEGHLKHIMCLSKLRGQTEDK